MLAIGRMSSESAAVHQIQTWLVWAFVHQTVLLKII